MLEEAKVSGLMDPMQFWKQWQDAWKTYYETSSRVWATMLDGGKTTDVNLYNPYQLWLKSIEDTQKQLSASLPGKIDPVEVSKQWFDATTDVWKRANEAGQDSIEFTTQWFKVIEETQTKLLSGEINSSDPVTFVKQWYDATSETLSRIVGEAMNSEHFLESQRKFIESFSSAVSISNRVNEETLKNLQIPTRSDVARVAELIVSLEEKVDKIEDAFENLEDSYTQVATGESIEELAGRFQQLESKLDVLDVLSTVAAQTEAIEGLASTEALAIVAARLNRVEGKLDTLDTLTTILAQTEAIEDLASTKAVEGLAEHLQQVESKLGTLDVLPTVLKRTEAVEGLSGRLQQVESKLGSLDVLPTVLARVEAMEGVTGRLDRVEGKLDTLLSALEKLSTHEESEAARPNSATNGNGTTRRRTSKKHEDVHAHDAENPESEVKP